MTMNDKFIADAKFADIYNQLIELRNRLTKVEEELASEKQLTRQLSQLIDAYKIQLDHVASTNKLINETTEQRSHLFTFQMVGNLVAALKEQGIELQLKDATNSKQTLGRN